MCPTYQSKGKYQLHHRKHRRTSTTTTRARQVLSSLSLSLKLHLLTRMFTAFKQLRYRQGLQHRRRLPWKRQFLLSCEKVCLVHKRLLLLQRLWLRRCRWVQAHDTAMQYILICSKGELDLRCSSFQPYHPHLRRLWPILRLEGLRPWTCMWLQQLWQIPQAWSRHRHWRRIGLLRT